MVRKKTVSSGQSPKSSLAIRRAWRRRLTMTHTLSHGAISAAMVSKGVSFSIRHSTSTRRSAVNSSLYSGKISRGVQFRSFRAAKSGCVAVENTMVV